MLLWLGQNRANKASVDNLFDASLDANNELSAGPRVLKSNEVVSVGPTASNSNNFNENVDPGTSSIMKKARSSFSGEYYTVENNSGSNTNHNTVSPTGLVESTASSTSSSYMMSPKVIKKEPQDDNGLRSQIRSHLSSHHGLSAGPSGAQHLQPIARKRSVYQASLGGSGQARTSESSPEVSSSQNILPVISPVPSLESSEIDLELWDLDLHESSTSHSSGIYIYLVPVLPVKVR